MNHDINSEQDLFDILILNDTKQDSKKEEFSQAKGTVKEKLKKYVKWSQKQNHSYAKFLSLHQQSFQDQESRRCHRVFQIMSKALKKERTPQQCRSHHNKMLKKHKKLQAIVSAIFKNSKQTEVQNQVMQQEKLQNPTLVLTLRSSKRKRFENEDMSKIISYCEETDSFLYM